MAFTILNNTAAQMTLGELNKNITKVGRQLSKLSKGERVPNSRGADYAISESMRENIRSLGQDERNVKSGKDLLRVAEGAVQSQVNLMRSIKERVLNAANDSNSDEDRKIIQKEIDKYLDEIEDITYETKYNGRPLLHGNTTVNKIVLEELGTSGVYRYIIGTKSRMGYFGRWR
ncbi:MAG: flagellin [Selenomonadaceae bacterium]|nr:flagellin [Selenomonadaceae bacterium]